MHLSYPGIRGDYEVEDYPESVSTKRACVFRREVLRRRRHLRVVLSTWQKASIRYVHGTREGL